MKISQRNGGASSGPNSGYVLDGWFLGASGGTSRNYNVGAFTIGVPAAAGYESPNHASIVLSSMSTVGGYVYLNQKVEDVRTLSGQVVTMSFYAKAAAGTPVISVEMGQYFGTGGSPSANVNTDFGQVTLSTSWQRLSVTGTIPSVASKTRGDNNNDALMPTMWLSAGSTYNARTSSMGAQNGTFDIWGVQLERGSDATPLEVRSHAEELARCQRYYYRGTPGSTYGTHAWGIANSTSTVVALMELPVTLRAGAHTLEYSGTTVSNFGATSSAGGLVLGSYQSLDRVQIDCGAASGTPYTAGSPYGIRNNNDAAGYVGVSAEL